MPDAEAVSSTAEPNLSGTLTAALKAEFNDGFAKPLKSAEAAPAKEPKSEAEKSAENVAPASEAGKETQEKGKRGNAETRLSELLADLKRAGLSPAELKTFKREAQKVETKAEPSTAAPKVEAKPPELTKPARPNMKEFDGSQGKTFDDYLVAMDKYEAERDEYVEKLVDQKSDAKAEAKVREADARRAQEAQQKELHGKLEDTRKRYSDADEKVFPANEAIATDTAIPVAVKAMIARSDVLPDLLYKLHDELDEFAALAKSDPAAAIEKIVLMQYDIRESLKKPAKEAKGEAKVETKAEAKPPAKAKPSEVPDPPSEVGGRGAPGEDSVDAEARSHPGVLTANQKTEMTRRFMEGRR